MILREWRKREGLTTSQLAALVGVTQAMISFIEIGQRQPSKAVVLKLSEVTGIPPATLMFGEQESAQ
jgi:transcriptional regulator with XRE-family HTH domain